MDRQNRDSLRSSQPDPHGADTSSRMDPLPSADAPSNRAARRRTSRNAPSDVQGDTNADAPASSSIDAMNYAQTQAAIAETQGRLNVLTEHRTSLEVAYKRGTHWRDVVGSAFMSDDGVRVAWLSGSRLVNLSGVGETTPRGSTQHDGGGTERDNRTGQGDTSPTRDGSARDGNADLRDDNRTGHGNTSPNDGSARSSGTDLRDDNRTGEGVSRNRDARADIHDVTIHEHRTGEGGRVVGGGVSKTIPATSVDHEHTQSTAGNFRSHVDARRLTISVNGKIYNHVDETPDGHWVYRFDK